jgi:tetratricopeptide (TPR) repeat protein
VKQRPIPNRITKIRKVILLFLLPCLLGCAAGSVKPLLNDPDFKAENQPIRTVRILLITDDSYRRDEIVKFVSKCSNLVEIQVGVRLEIVDWYQIQWENELNDAFKMHIRIAADTWGKRNTFDIAVAPIHFDHRAEGNKLRVGAIDTFFWRYILVRELNPNILLHELFHGFLLQTGHSDDWIMKSERPPYGHEWYWLTPEDRRGVLRNKWRDFNVMSTVGTEDERRSSESWFYYVVGTASMRRKDFNQAVLLLNKSLETNPAHAPAYNTLSWLYATADEPGLRNGQKAVELALKGCELSNWANPGYIETLAAAYARGGDFEKAVRWQEKALEVARSSTNTPDNLLHPVILGQKNKQTEPEERLELYRMHKPWPPD